jgi:hypothetical protein
MYLLPELTEEQVSNVSSHIRCSLSSNLSFVSALILRNTKVQGYDKGDQLRVPILSQMNPILYPPHY